jgi:hypothetical protein
MLSKPILLNNFKRSFNMNEDYLLNEELLTEESAVENRIKELAQDPEVQSKMGAGADKLEHAFMVLFKRGYGAAQTNWGAVNPAIKKLGRGPAAYNAWGHARLNAFIDKRNAYKTSDADVADWLQGKGEKPEPN